MNAIGGVRRLAFDANISLAAAIDAYEEARGHLIQRQEEAGTLARALAVIDAESSEIRRAQELDVRANKALWPEP